MGKKKKRYVIVSFLIFIFIHICDIRVVSAEDNFNVVIPVNAGETSVRYTEYISDTEGPMGFSVNDGKAYVLDSENERILIYSPDGYVDEIEFGFYSRQFELVNNELFVIDYFDSKLIRYTMAGVKKGEYSLEGIEDDYIEKITVVDDIPAIITRTGRVLAYNSAEGEFSDEVDSGLLQTTIRTYMYNGCQVREVKQNLEYGYTVTTSEIGTDYLYIEKVISKKKVDGQTDSFFKINLNGWVIFPEQYIYYDEEELYVMYGFEDKLVIQKAIFQDQYTSELMQMSETAKQGSVDFGKSRNTITVSGDKTSLSRVDVIDRAEEMRTITWTLNAGHKIAVSNATLPKFVADAVPGSILSGIPYCWGGFFGVSDTSSVGSYGGKFSTEIIREFFSSGGRTIMYMAGNVNGNTSGYVGRTIGVDGSGFISFCYGLPFKEYTGSLMKHYYQVDLEDLQAGDMLVSTTAGHSMLYVGRNGNDYVVYDCNSTITTGRVLKRTVSETYILNKKYEGRSPWEP